jgi:hypothetical protein
MNGCNGGLYEAARLRRAQQYSLKLRGMRILRLAAFRTPPLLPHNFLDGGTTVQPLPLRLRLRLLFSQRSTVSSAFGTDERRETEPPRPSDL